jgi:predicted RNA-binding protein YlqC (UPF0109 family)
VKFAPLVEYVVKNIVDEPEAVRIEESQSREGLMLYVHVAPNDVGKIIGKSGRVITALRYVVSGAAAKGRQKAFVKVVTD